MAKAAGFSQIEVVVSTFIIGVLMVASLSSVATTSRTVRQEADRPAARALADDLLSEIVTLPLAGSPLIGRGPSASRVDFSCVEDYHQYVESPPAYRGGQPYADHDGWSRSVLLQPVDPSNWNVPLGSPSSVCRITVRAARGTQTLAEAIGYRTTAEVQP
jgi:hypothetical protein